jgi:hypothetical protein
MKHHFLKSLIAVFLVTGLFSCMDHFVPETSPEIETLAFEFIPVRVSADEGQPLKWNLKFKSLGTAGIKEYGIVYLAAGEDHLISNMTPALSNTDAKLIKFTDTAVADVKLQKTASIGSFSWVNYRAYAKLNNDDVVYGEVIKFAFAK